MTKKEMIENYMATHADPWNVSAVADALGFTFGTTAVIMAEICICSKGKYVWNTSHTSLIE